MVNYFFTEEQEALRDLVRQITDERVIPVRADMDEKEEFPREIMRILGESDIFGVYIPEEYGGLGGGMTELCIATEELSRGCVGVSTTYAATGLGSFPIMIAGNDAQKEKYLPEIAKGKMLAAFALTEAGAGSDAGAITTRAVREGDYYVLNGVKQWITNGGEADVYTVIAMTNPEKGARGASAFIIENGTKGLGFGKKEKKLGIRCSATREVVLEDCRVPCGNLLGREGRGFIITLKTLDLARVGVGAQGVGLCAGALGHSIEYARERRQFGKPIASFQAIQHMLARMATLTEASRALVYAVARSIDKGEKDQSKDAAISKLFASDAAMEVASNAIQILGGYGYMRDYPVEKMLRDAKILQIYEGTNQIQCNTIASALIKEAASQR